MGKGKIVKIVKIEKSVMQELNINYALIVVDKYWDGDVNTIMHFVGYENSITHEDRNSFISELANPQEDWCPIADLEKEQLKIIEAPKNVIEYFRKVLQGQK